LLEVTAGPGKGRVFRVSGDRFIIGRGPRDEVDVNLEPDRFVSRRHAVGHIENDEVVVNEWPDAPSKAGLMQDGVRRVTVRLKEGERLWVGSTELTFHFAERPTMSWLQTIRRWIRRGLILLPLAAVGVGVAAMWPGHPNRDDTPDPRTILEEVRNARNCSEFGRALNLLSCLDVTGESGEIREEVEHWKGECRRLQGRVGNLQELEKALRIDEARDGWQRLALEFSANDPLRIWIETNAVPRLNARLERLR